MSRTSNAVKNSIWGICSKVTTLLMPFLVMSAMIRNLGVEYLGINSLFTSILSVLSLTELGVGSAIVYSMYHPIAIGDDAAVSALLNLYRTIYRYIGLAILTIGIILMPFLPKLIKGNVPSDINIYILFALYLINVLISYLLFGYRSSLLYACQRNDIISKATIIFHTFMYVCQIIILILFKNYYLYTLLLPVSSICINLSCAFVSKKLFPQYICNGKVDKEKKADIKKRVIGLSMNKIAFASRNAFDSIILSVFLGLATVAVYNNYYYIISSIAALMKIITTSITASVGNSIAIESKEKNENDMKIINFIYCSLSGLCFCFVVSIFQPFMRLWVGEEYLFNDTIMLLIGFYFLVDKMENIIGIYYDAAGMWWKGKYKGLLEASVNLILNIILGYYWGVVGILIATIISMLAVAIPLSAHYMYKYYFERNETNFIFHQILFLICFTIIGVACYFVCRIIPTGSSVVTSVILMLLRLIASTLVFGVLYFVVFCRTYIFKISISWIKSHAKILHSK